MIFFCVLIFTLLVKILHLSLCLFLKLGQKKLPGKVCLVTLYLKVGYAVYLDNMYIHHKL